MLDEMVAQYSNMFHSSIKMTPVQASEKKNEAEVYRNLYPVGEEIKTPKFAIGYLVRITIKRIFLERAIRQGGLNKFVQCRK